MIRGLHGLFYSSDAAATRAFLRDQLRLPHTDAGEGWLIFDLPEADVGVHPLDDEGRPPAGTHDVSFFCDDIHGTVAELSARGVRFRSEVEDHGYGLVTYFTMPGGIEVQLYEPKYAKRRSTRPKRSRAAAAKRARGRKPARARR
jgi:Glyoxalase/Bleomycin resistance protein/Dioxygenase superfamily